VFQVADSILDTVKKNLGLGADYDVFDLDIMTHINSAFMNLNQLGIGPAEGFMIEDDEPTWDTFLGTQTSPLFNSVKLYVVYKAKLGFDPPATSFHIAAIEKQIQELEWRLLILRDELMATETGVITPVLPDVPAEPETVPSVPVVDGGGAGEL
jgi:hypothetical protein